MTMSEQAKHAMLLLVALLVMLVASLPQRVGAQATSYLYPCSQTFSNQKWVDTIKAVIASGNSGISFTSTSNKVLVYQSTNGNYFIQVWNSGDPKLRINANGTIDFIRATGTYVAGQINGSTGDVVATTMNTITVTSETTQINPYLQLCGVTDNFTIIRDPAQANAKVRHYFSHYNGTQTIEPMKHLQFDGSEPQPPAPDPEPEPTEPQVTERDLKLVSMGIVTLLVYNWLKLFVWRSKA